MKRMLQSLHLLHDLIQRLPFSCITDLQIFRPENFRHKRIQLFYKLLFSGVKILFQPLDKLIIGNTGHSLLESRHRRAVGSAPKNRCAVSCAYQICLGSGFYSCNDLIETLGILQAGSIQDLSDHTEQNVNFRIHHLSSYREHGVIVLCRVHMIKHLYSNVDTAGLGIDLIGQLSVSIMSSVYISKNRLQKTQIWDFFRRKVFQIKHQIKICNSVGGHLMIKEQASVHIQRLIGKSCCFFADVLSFQHGNTFFCSRLLRCLLIGLQSFCFLYKRLFFLLRKTFQMSLKLLFQSFFLTGSKTFGGYKSDHRTMGIVQQIFSDQLLKISLSCQLLQLFKHRESLNLGKSFFITVQPVSKHCQTVHQSLGPGRKISLSVSEFHTVDTCIQSFSVNSIGCDIFKSGTDDLYKLFFFVPVCSLCHNIKIRLHDSVIIGAINVHTDLSVQKSLF